jgi:hypothetical protein
VKVKGAIHLQHDKEGNEFESLGLLWDYCKSHLKQKIVYLHSKGTFHPSEQNDNLRRLLTRGVLSEECSNLPDICNVCSFRMSPIPHVHTPGNMWLARCSYVNKLIDPRLFKEVMYNINKNNGDTDERFSTLPCRGLERFASEHWVHSHPSVSSCDLLDDDKYVWGYWNIPSQNFSFHMRMAPRFNFTSFVPNVDEKYRCGFSKTNHERYKFGCQILNEYKMMYGEHILPPKSWFGWEYYGLNSLNLCWK